MMVQGVQRGARGCVRILAGVSAVSLALIGIANLTSSSVTLADSGQYAKTKVTRITAYRLAGEVTNSGVSNEKYTHEGYT